MDWLTLLVGAALGFVLSLLWWASLAFGIRPAVRADRVIRQRIDERLPEETKTRVSVRVMNHSRLRPALEIVVHAQLMIPAHSQSHSYNLVTIPVGVAPEAATLMKLARRKKHTFDLRTNEIPWQCWLYLPEPIVTRLRSGDRVGLDELLDVVDGTHVRLFVAATDGFSGSRRVYTTETIDVRERFPDE